MNINKITYPNLIIFLVLTFLLSIFSVWVLSVDPLSSINNELSIINSGLGDISKSVSSLSSRIDTLEAETTKLKEVKQTNTTKSSKSSSKGTPAKSGVLTKAKGVNYFNGRKETWYSQRVLAGGGLKIQGRHVDSAGLVRDGDGYICVAASDLPYGSIVQTSLGAGKVYDSGCAAGTTDIYTNW